MKTVAIIARGDFRRGIWHAQHHRLAMIRLAVMFEPVLMTFAATLVAQGFEIFPRRIDNLMRAVAINANWPAWVAFREQLAVNAFIVCRLDSDVAFAAGRGDIRMVDRRIAVHAALYFVRAMTIIARGRDDQTHFQ